MFAVVNIQGFQFKVQEGMKVYVYRLPQAVGDTVEFNEVLLVDREGAVSVGKPFVEGATVTARVLDHRQDDKVIVFKKKRRKGYQVKNGHRQALSQIEIQAITA
ncbi:MAG: 50S ribosomal protein L21 [Bacteroidia bacterium]|nr:50S ribosomal protein L21 [Bacteroidia bacterium]